LGVPCGHRVTGTLAIRPTQYLPGIQVNKFFSPHCQKGEVKTGNYAANILQNNNKYRVLQNKKYSIQFFVYSVSLMATRETISWTQYTLGHN
jgi:hypothetical protein